MSARSAEPIRCGSGERGNCPVALADPSPQRTIDQAWNPGALDDLGPYDRATVTLWARNYGELSQHPHYGHLIEAAVHAILAGLREYHQPPLLFTAHETKVAAHFILIRSLVQGEPSDETLWTVRDAAFHLRWVEVTGLS